MTTRNFSTQRRPALRPLATALAAAALLVAALPVQAQITSSGINNTWPTPLSVPNGVFNADLGTNGLWIGNPGIGNSGSGSLSVQGGSNLRVGSFNLGDGGLGNGSLTIDGAGTYVSLVADGYSVVNRFDVGNWGTGTATVSGGATLNGRAEAANCLGDFHYCNNFIGNTAGSNGTFTVTGAGSTASFLQAFVVGGVAVFRPPIDTFYFGTPGGTSQGKVNVLAGGLLTTDRASIAQGPNTASALGTERSFGDVLIDGANSRWRVTGGTLDNSAANFGTANHRNAWANVMVSNGGQLWIDGKNGMFNNLNLTTGGGRTDMTITGGGSDVLVTGDAGSLQVGQSLGSASLSVLNGGKARGMYYMVVGRNGSFGDLLVNGVGSEIVVNGTASAAANGGTSSNAIFDIGRNGGTGVVNVTGGGKISVLGTESRPGGMRLDIGRDANSAGTLNINGAGSQVLLSALSVLPGGGPAEAINPTMRVGRDGSGNLNITNGGKLLIDGQAVSTAANSRGTSLFIGGNGDTTVGGKGIAVVSGLGSEIRLTGWDTNVSVGIGPQSNGQLTLADQASLTVHGMHVGRGTGVGVLKVDNATINLVGQQAADNGGAYLNIGRGDGIGVATMSNGAVINLSNLGTGGASINLGGTGQGPKGDGSLTMSGGSAINFITAPGQAFMTVGRDGSGLLRMKGASSIDLGSGNLMVGRLSGGDGTVIATEGSRITAGWVGVGRNLTDAATGASANGGTGTMVLNGATLTAQTVVIGTNGYLGGTGGSISAANIYNYGIFSPGSSPGTFTIDGNYTAMAGSRLILEVENDGHGGFNTDQVFFTKGKDINLSALNVEFHFLGATDPNAFKSTGKFDIDTFLALKDTSGQTSSFNDAAFSTASFSARADSYAISSFTYSAASGATFIAAAVPEPSSWAMLLAGLGLMGCVAKRRLSVRA